MSVIDSKFIILLGCVTFLLFATSCSQCSDSNVSAESQWKSDLVQNYCGVALSKLARGIPEGVKPIVERVNPYPAIPDYRMFPDVSATHHNAKMLFKLARCVHQKCVDPDSKKAQRAKTPMPAGCEATKSNYIFKSLLDVANSCGGSRYLKACMAQTLQEEFQKREGQPLQVCDALLEGEHIVKEALGLPVQECDLNQDNCEAGLRCVVNGAGSRCVEAAGTDLGALVEKLGGTGRLATDEKAPGFIYEEKALEAVCTSSRECPKGASCLSVYGGTKRCLKHCAGAKDCSEKQTCHPYMGSARICLDSCDSGELAATDAGSLCVPGPAGAVVAALDGKALMTAYAAAAEPKKQQSYDEVTFATLVDSLNVKQECGNGVVEFPEACDAGEANGVTAFGSWCTSKCELAECGDGKMEAPESCECLTGWALRAANDDSEDKFNTLCPSSFARSDGSELALGWVCSSKCTVITPPEAFMSPRKNKNYLPEFICSRPKRADGTFRPECIPTNVDYDPALNPAAGDKPGVNPSAPSAEPAGDSAP